MYPTYFFVGFLIAAIVILAVVVLVAVYDQKIYEDDDYDPNESGVDEGGTDDHDIIPVAPPLAVIEADPDDLATYESRLRLTEARASCPTSSALSANVQNYTLLPATTTGVFSTWDTNTTVLGDMTAALVQAAWFAVHNPDHADRPRAVSVVEDFITRFHAKISTLLPLAPNVFPWGTNWYQFSVSVPYLIAYYLLVRRKYMDNVARLKAIDVINIIITNPSSSIGWTRTGANSIYMAGPWILAHYFMGDSSEAVESDSYKTVTKEAGLPIRSTPSEDGLHMDLSYMYHSGAVLFGYLNTITGNLTRYLFPFDPEGFPNNPTVTWTKILSIISHPTLTTGAVGLLGRERSLVSPLSANARNGVEVMPLIGFIRVNGSDYRFSMRTQKTNIAFYEADQTVNDYAAYWVQWRAITRPNSSFSSTATLQPGFIVLEGNEDSLMQIPSTTTTTQVLFPARGKSYVFADDRTFGVAYNEYQITQLLGQVDVRERIIIDVSQDIIIANLVLRNYGTDSVNVVWSPHFEPTTAETITIPKTSGGNFVLREIMVQLSTGSITTQSSPITETLVGDLAQFKYRTWSVDESSGAREAILLKNNRPIRCNRYVFEKETEIISSNFNGQEYLFGFDPSENQWVA